MHQYNLSDCKTEILFFYTAETPNLLGCIPAARPGPAMSPEGVVWCHCVQLMGVPTHYHLTKVNKKVSMLV